MALRRSVTRALVDHALREVAETFPPDLRNRGVARAYMEYRAVLHSLEPYLRKSRGRLRVLDLGAGAGVVPLTLSGLGAEVTVADTWIEYEAEVDNQMGSTADILKRYQNAGVKACLTDITRTPLSFASESYDLVTMFDVIEHLHMSPKALINDVYRIVATGGHFVVTTPNIANLLNRLRLLTGRTVHYPIDQWYDADPFTVHVREFTHAELRRMIELAGFSIVAARLSEAHHHNTPLPGGRWRPGVHITRPVHLARAAYLAIAQAWPGFRYGQLVVGVRT